MREWSMRGRLLLTCISCRLVVNKASKRLYPRRRHDCAGHKEKAFEKSLECFLLS